MIYLFILLFWIWMQSHDVFEGITEEEGESQVDQEVYSDVESD